LALLFSADEFEPVVEAFDDPFVLLPPYMITVVFEVDELDVVSADDD
jgi:hypothetical protein